MPLDLKKKIHTMARMLYLNKTRCCDSLAFRYLHDLAPWPSHWPHFFILLPTLQSSFLKFHKNIVFWDHFHALFILFSLPEIFFCVLGFLKGRIWAQSTCLLKLVIVFLLAKVLSPDDFYGKTHWVTYTGTQSLYLQQAWTLHFW